MKKSFAEAVAPKTWHSWPHGGHTNHWGSVPTDSGQSLKVPLVTQPPLSPLVATSAPHQEPHPVPQHAVDGAPCRAKLVEELGKVETALASLPQCESLMDTKVQLEKKKEELKKGISDTRPLCSRLDTCMAAVERAKKRLLQASDQEMAARQAWEEACQVRAAVEEDLAVKEEQLNALRARAMAAATGTPHLPSGNSIMDLEKNMTMILEEMRAGGRAPQEKVAEAMTLMSGLFAHLTEVSRHCREAEDTMSMASTTRASPADAEVLMEPSDAASLLADRCTTRFMKRPPEVATAALERSAQAHPDMETLLQEASAGLA